MKSLLPSLVLISIVVLSAQAQVGQQAAAALSSGAVEPTPGVDSAYSIIERGPHQQVWAKITWQTNATGRIAARTNSYTELATGLNYKNAKGEWVGAKEVIESFPDGAVAQQGQHQVLFANDLATQGAIDLQTPDGKRMRSHVLGLSYFDSASGKSVWLAEVTNCQGVIAPPNQVQYQNAFSGLQADVRYTCTKAGFEQDIILREQPPGPEAYGLNLDTTKLQVLTEFVDPPQPKVAAAGVPDNAGAVNSPAAVVDEELTFGAMRMGRGKAFTLADESDALSGKTGRKAGFGAGSVPVRKHWQKLEGRDLLIEEVPATAVKEQLQSLPKASGASVEPATNSGRRMVSGKRLLPGNKIASMSDRPMQLAQAAVPRHGAPGFVLDYEMLNSTLTNYTFRGDTTYYVSGFVLVSGAAGGMTTFEGGTVIKYTNSSSATLLIGGTNVCKTGPYRPAVFTSKDDNSVGEVVGGSTGNPATPGLATYLHVGRTCSQLQYLRFAYAGTAVIEDYMSPVPLWHCQFVNCGTAVVDYEMLYPWNQEFYNVLLSCCGKGVVSRGGGVSAPMVVVAQHVTADQLGYFGFCDNGRPLVCVVANSVLTAVTNWFNDGNYDFQLDHCATAASGSGIYQTFGAACYYLVDSSTNRNAGSTTIDSTLLAELRQKTTYPPVVYSNVLITADTSLGPRAQRDTDIPDLGYHYDPLDYAFKSVWLTNATLQLLSGTAVATFGNNGISLHNGSHLICEGAPANLNHIVRYNMVQECSNTNWNGSGGSVVGDWLGGSPSPQTSFRFTDWSMPAQDGYQFSTWGKNMVNSFADCQFHGGTFAITDPSIALTNCLFERVNTTIDDSGTGPLAPTVANCLFFGGKLAVTHWESDAWVFRDNLFDQVNICQDGDFANAYNGYTPGTTRLSPTNGNDVVASISYETGPLGSYYQPTTSYFIDKGSTNADLLGLYCHTTQTNQLLEANSIVDVGFHYPALDSNGDSVDPDSDGVPNWQDARPSDPTIGILSITIETPANGSTVQ